jgi:hypothetical protein
VVPTLVENLVMALSASARVTSRACFALHMFADACEGERDKPTNTISPFFSVVVQKLLQVIMREDWADDNMRVSATEVRQMHSLRARVPACGRRAHCAHLVKDHLLCLRHFLANAKQKLVHSSCRVLKQRRRACNALSTMIPTRPFLFLLRMLVLAESPAGHEHADPKQRKGCAACRGGHAHHGA